MMCKIALLKVVSLKGGEDWRCEDFPCLFLVSLLGLPCLLWSHFPLRLLGSRLLRLKVLFLKSAGQQDHRLDLLGLGPRLPPLGLGHRQDRQEHLLGLPFRPHLYRVLRLAELHHAQPLHSSGDLGGGVQLVGECPLADCCSHHT